VSPPTRGRAGRAIDRFEFDPSELSRLLEVVAWLSAHRDGWLNLLPGVEASDVPVEAPGLFAIFGSTRPPVSMCTWMPPGRGRRSLDEVTVGIEHGLGRRILPDLESAGLSVPAAWRVWGDHPRRGLVVRIPSSAPDRQVLQWTLAAGARLCDLPMTGSWQAEVHQPVI
jgi:hypothetical protein